MGIEQLARNSTCLSAKYNDNAIIFEFHDGTKFKMWHHQDCCESVTLEDVAGGDLSDLEGQCIIEAYETTDRGDRKGDYDESHTWTFYTIRTNLVTLTIRWYGTSNGHYSEGVDIDQIE